MVMLFPRRRVFEGDGKFIATEHFEFCTPPGIMFQTTVPEKLPIVVNFDVFAQFRQILESFISIDGTAHERGNRAAWVSCRRRFSEGFGHARFVVGEVRNPNVGVSLVSHSQIELWIVDVRIVRAGFLGPCDP